MSSFCIKSLNFRGLLPLRAVPDPDLEIRGRGGRSSRNLDKGGGVQNIFSALQA